MFSQKVTDSWSRADKQLEAENSKSFWSKILEGVDKILTGVGETDNKISKQGILMRDPICYFFNCWRCSRYFFIFRQFNEKYRNPN